MLTGRAGRRSRTLALTVTVIMLLRAPVTQAARPMVVDDARIVDGGACQLEAWQKVNRGSREHWAFPACNPTGSLEMTLGGNDLPDGRGGRANDYVLQGKTLFKVLETNGYAWGLAAGVIRHADSAPGQGRHSAAYFYLPMSASWADDRLVVHANLGAQNNRDTGTKPATYGLGTELNFTPRFALIAETYGDNHNRAFYQAGVRFWVVQGRFQIDATHGAQSGNYGDSRWWTVGVRLISPPFLK